MNTLEVRCSQHLAEADGFSFLKITLQREIWPMGHSRKTDLDKMKDRFMTQISCSKKKKQISCSFGEVGQGNLSTCWTDYDQSCLTWHKCHSRWNWTFSWDTGLQPNRMNWWVTCFLIITLSSDGGYKYRYRYNSTYLFIYLPITSKCMDICRYIFTYR